MSIVDFLGEEARIEKNDLLVFDQHLGTILFIRITDNDHLIFDQHLGTIVFNREKILYFSQMRRETDKVYASFIKELEDFLDFAKFLEIILELTGHLIKSSKDYFIWSFTNEVSREEFTINSNDLAVFCLKTKQISIYANKDENEPTLQMYIPFIRNPNQLDEFLSILGYFYSLRHQIFHDRHKRFESNSVKRTFF